MKTLSVVVHLQAPAVLGSTGSLVISLGSLQVKQSFAVVPEQVPQLSWQGSQAPLLATKIVLGFVHLQVPATPTVAGVFVISEGSLQVRQSESVSPEQVLQDAGQG